MTSILESVQSNTTNSTTTNLQNLTSIVDPVLTALFNSNRTLPQECPTSFDEFIANDKSSTSILFQASQLSLLLATLVPIGRYCSAMTHAALSLGNFLLGAWLFREPCYRAVAPTLMSWLFVLSLANVFRSLFSLASGFSGIIRKDLRPIYQKLFEPIGVSVLDFRRLMSISKVEQLDDGDQYAVESVTPIDRLSLLVTGRIAVSSNSQFLHSIYPAEFLDSPEWESNFIPKRNAQNRSRSTSVLQLQPPSKTSKLISQSHFNISLTATTASTFVYWNRDDLQKLLSEEPTLDAVLSVILARDITNKLYQMNSRMAAQKSSDIDIRLPVIITSFRRQQNQTIKNNVNHHQGNRHKKNNGIDTANTHQNHSNRLANQLSFGGETSSTSVTVESRSNSVVRQQQQQLKQNEESFELQLSNTNARRKSNMSVYSNNHNHHNSISFQLQDSRHESPASNRLHRSPQRVPASAEQQQDRQRLLQEHQQHSRTSSHSSSSNSFSVQNNHHPYKNHTNFDGASAIPLLSSSSPTSHPLSSTSRNHPSDVYSTQELAL